jgi:anthranilate phosphoribosyltransferase
MKSVMTLIMSGEATDAQIGAFLTALMVKGETVDEIVGAATIMRELSAKVETRSDKIVDSVGTGGDGAKLFNVSTASALVASAAGASVAKHGNRAATGNSGSADVLEAAGVNIAITPQQVGQCVDQCGVGFMFAPAHHSAMRYAIGPRKEIGIRTIFNLLGPLTNPANAGYQLVGVFSQHWVRPLAEVFAEMGSTHTLVVSSDDGLDEISIAADTSVAEFKNGSFFEYRISPEQFGIAKTSLESIVVTDSGQSLDMIKIALGGEPGAAYDMLALNAGATIYAGDLADSLEQGVQRAREVLDSGKGLEKLAQLVKMSSSF